MRVRFRSELQSSRRRHTRSLRDWSSDRKSTRLNSSHVEISYAVFCLDRKSTRLNSSHVEISYAVFCLEQKSTRLNSSHVEISYAVFCLKKKQMLRSVRSVNTSSGTARALSVPIVAPFCSTTDTRLRINGRPKRCCS